MAFLIGEHITIVIYDVRMLTPCTYGVYFDKVITMTRLTRFNNNENITRMQNDQAYQIIAYLDVKVKIKTV